MRLLCAALIATLAGSPNAALAEPLTLTSAIDAARRNHPDIRVAASNEDVARAQTGIALSGYLPSIGLNALGRGDLSNFRPVVVGTAASGSSSTSFPFQGSLLYSASLNLNQLVFDGGRTLAQLAQARAQLAQAAEDLLTQGIAVESSVTAAYFSALEGDAQLAVALEYEAQMKTQLAFAKKLIGAGVRPEFEAITAETRSQRATLERIRAQGATSTRRATLIAALGIEQDPGFTLVDAYTRELPEEKIPLDELVARAIASRPELRSLEASRKAAEQQVRAQRSDYFPSMGLGLSGSMTGSSDNPKPLFDFYATLSLQQQIFTGLSTYRSAQGARAQLAVVRARLAGARVVVRQSVASARAALDVAKRSDDQAASLVDQADKLVKSALKRYEAGLLTSLELFDAQSQRVLALGQRVTAHYAVALSRADLRRSIGGTIVGDEALR